MWQEAKIMALMVRARDLGNPVDWLLHSKRVLGEDDKLWSRVTAGESQGEIRFTPVETLEQAARMIDWYRARWEIEMFFHVLKNGCRIEALRLT